MQKTHFSLYRAVHRASIRQIVNCVLHGPAIRIVGSCPDMVLKSRGFWVSTLTLLLACKFTANATALDTTAFLCQSDVSYFCLSIECRQRPIPISNFAPGLFPVRPEIHSDDFECVHVEYCYSLPSTDTVLFKCIRGPIGQTPSDALRALDHHVREMLLRSFAACIYVALIEGGSLAAIPGYLWRWPVNSQEHNARFG